MDEQALERIYRAHLIGGRPVEDFIFHRHFPSGQEATYAPDLRGDGPLESTPWAQLGKEAESEEEEESIGGWMRRRRSCGVVRHGGDVRKRGLSLSTRAKGRGRQRRRWALWRGRGGGA